MAAAMTASISADVGGRAGDEDLGSSSEGLTTFSCYDINRRVRMDRIGNWGAGTHTR